MTASKTVFIADLHLSGESTDSWRAFESFCSRSLVAGDRLFILGDLVEYWIGDDDDRPFTLQLTKHLASLSSRGVELAFMRGNRDFMIGQEFCHRTGMQLLPDPCALRWGDKRLLLTHGDLLCTQDMEYQAARRIARETQWIKQFLSATLTERIAHMDRLRQRSAQSQAKRPPEQMDAMPDAACRMLQSWGCDVLIHGHTHRPKLHWHEVGGRQLPRYVLSDWRPESSCVVLQGDDCRLQDIPAA